MSTSPVASVTVVLPIKKFTCGNVPDMTPFKIGSGKKFTIPSSDCWHAMIGPTTIPRAQEGTPSAVDVFLSMQGKIPIDLNFGGLVYCG